jgi:hypothetical protein
LPQTSGQSLGWPTPGERERVRESKRERELERRYIIVTDNMAASTGYIQKRTTCPHAALISG